MPPQSTRKYARMSCPIARTIADGVELEGWEGVREGGGVPVQLFMRFMLRACLFAAAYAQLWFGAREACEICAPDKFLAKGSWKCNFIF